MWSSILSYYNLTVYFIVSQITFFTPTYFVFWTTLSVLSQDKSKNNVYQATTSKREGEWTRHRTG